MPYRRALLAIVVVASVSVRALPADADEERNRAEITLRRMSTVATAVHLYMMDFNAAPAANSVEELRSVLTPTYIRNLPTRDGWDTPLRYSKTGKDSFQIISAGADRTFEVSTWSTPARSIALHDDAVLSVSNTAGEGKFTRVWIDESGKQVGAPSELSAAITQSVVNAEVEKWKSLPPEQQDTYLRTTTTRQWMTATAAAIALYQLKNGAYPEAKSIDELANALVPSVVAQIFTHDAWGTDFRYIRSSDGKSYTLVSAGADGVFDETSWSKRSDDLSSANDDAVIQNGGFVRRWSDNSRPGDTPEMRARRRYKPAAQPLLARADERYAAHDYAAALNAYMKAVDADPAVAELERLQGYTPVAMYSVSADAKPSAAEQAALEKGEKKAVEALRQYLKLHPDDRKALDALIDRLPAAEAEAIVDRQIEAHPRDVEWYKSRASLIAKQGDFDRSLAAYQKIVDLDPGNAETHYIMGVVVYEKVSKDPKVTAAQKLPLIMRGIKELDRATELKPDYVEPMMYRNLLLRQEALLESDPTRQKELIARADGDRRRAMEVMTQRREARNKHDAAPDSDSPAAAAQGAPLRVGGDVKAPVVIHRVEPVVPAEAINARISGIVIVELVIDKTGRVTSARVIKPLLHGVDEAALDAVRQWTFAPGTLNGAPVDVIFNLTVNIRPPKEVASQ